MKSEKKVEDQKSQIELKWRELNVNEMTINFNILCSLMEERVGNNVYNYLVNYHRIDVWDGSISLVNY